MAIGRWLNLVSPPAGLVCRQLCDGFPRQELCLAQGANQLLTRCPRRADYIGPHVATLRFLVGAHPACRYHLRLSAGHSSVQRQTASWPTRALRPRVAARAEQLGANAMNGGDNSVLAGLISAAALVLMNYAVGLATYRSKRIEALGGGRAEGFIHNRRA